MIEHTVEQNSIEWFQLRAGKPTASEFSRLVNNKALLKTDLIKSLASLGEEKDLKKMKLDELQLMAFLNNIPSAEWVTSKTNYVYDLAAEIVMGVDETAFQGSDATDHGNVYESHAVKAYEELTGEKARSVGFITDDDVTHGCSPDRLVGDDGLLEIKCPYSKSKYIEYLYMAKDGCPPDFYIQIQGQLMITGREWCDLVIDHPQGFDPKIVRVLPDLAAHEGLEKAISETIKQRDKVVLEVTGF